MADWIDGNSADCNVPQAAMQLGQGGAYQRRQERGSPMASSAVTPKEKNGNLMRIFTSTLTNPPRYYATRSYRCQIDTVHGVERIVVTGQKWDVTEEIEAILAVKMKHILAELGYCGIAYCPELAAEGNGWESAAEQDSEYFATLREAIAHQCGLYAKPAREVPDVQP